MSDVPDPNLEPGKRFAGKFLIERLLGKGGMGAVYLATHEGLRQKVAIKVLLGEVAKNEEAVRRFMNEASAAAAIQSDHVARVSDVSQTEGGLTYMVMEFLEGQDLAQLVEERGKLPHGEAVSYVLQAIEGVHQAHAARIVHRDLKPSNLFLATKADGSQVIKVLDFGISKMTGLEAEASSLTSTKAMLGSPLYMSPEQLRNSKGVDLRADIWSLGVILYELLTGAVPYDGESLGELFANILERQPVPLRERDPGIPEALEQAVLCCLRKNKDERFGSVAELAAALAPFAPANAGLRSTRAMVQAVGVWDSTGPHPAGSSVTSSGKIGTGAGARPLAHTGSGPAAWATGSMSSTVVTTSKAPVALMAALGVLLVVGGGLGAFWLTRPEPAAPLVPVAPSEASGSTVPNVNPEPSASVAAVLPSAEPSSVVPPPEPSAVASASEAQAVKTSTTTRNPNKGTKTTTTGSSGTATTATSSTKTTTNPKPPAGDPFGIPSSR